MLRVGSCNIPILNFYQNFHNNNHLFIGRQLALERDLYSECVPREINIGTRLTIYDEAQLNEEETQSYCAFQLLIAHKAAELFGIVDIPTHSGNVPMPPKSHKHGRSGVRRRNNRNGLGRIVLECGTH